MRKRMMAAVPKATVIITNPTHYSVALQYERGMDAPVCVAKGVDAVALKIREIARVAGLIFQGYPGRQEKERHLQSSASLLFKVFSEYDPKNLLIRQCYQEVLDFQLEELRLRKALMRINKQEVIVKYPEKPTPFAFPIMVDRMREKLTSEKLEEQVKKMQLRFGDEVKVKKTKVKG